MSSCMMCTHINTHTHTSVLCFRYIVSDAKEDDGVARRDPRSRHPRPSGRLAAVDLQAYALQETIERDVASCRAPDENDRPSEPFWRRQVGSVRGRPQVPRRGPAAASWRAPGETR